MLRMLLFISLTSFGLAGYSQNIHVFPEQPLTFGEFYFSGSSGGTIDVTASGDWVASGEVHQLHPTHQPALFTITTDSQTPVYIQVEIYSGNLQDQEGNKLRLIPEQPENYTFSIQQGKPLKLHIGGRLEIEPGAVSGGGNFSGDFSIRAILVNE